MNLRKKKKGFTLIELMAVVAIIAILAAVLVPTVSGYITRSKKTAVITQVREAVNAIEIYNTTAKTPIADSETVSTAVGKLSEDIKPKNIGKLGGAMTVETAKKINKDQDAVGKIKIDESGNFSSYEE